MARASTEPSRAPGVASLYALLVASTVASSAFIPLAPTFARQLELSNVELGITFAAGTIPLLAAAAPLGALGDRMSPRTLTILAGWLVTVGSAGHAVAFDFTSLVLARLVFGLGIAVIWTTGLAWLAALGSGRTRSRALSGSATAAGAGVSIGPLYGGLVGELWSAQAAFGLVSLALSAVTVLLLRTERSEPQADTHLPLFQTARALVRSRPLAAGAVTLALSGLATGAVNLLVPLQLEDNGLSAGYVGLILTLTTLLFTLGSASVVAIGDRAASIKAAAAGAVLLGLACAIVVASTSTQATIAFLLARVPAWALLATTPYALIAIFAGRSQLGYGAVIGIVTQIWAAASSLSPIATAAVLEATSSQVAYLLLTIVASGAALWLLSGIQGTRVRPSSAR